MGVVCILMDTYSTLVSAVEDRKRACEESIGKVCMPYMNLEKSGKTENDKHKENKKDNRGGW